MPCSEEGRALGPLFILGFPRSGTTAMARAVSGLGRFGSYAREGHFLYIFAAPFARILRGEFNENSVLRGDGAVQTLTQEFRAMANRLYSPTHDPADQQWIDKTPDLAQVRAVPVINKLWPSSRFIFLYRPAEDAVRSSVAVWRQRVEGNEGQAAERWVQCQRAWRAARPDLGDRYVEVYQPHMLTRPEAVAQSMAGVLGLADAEIDSLARTWREDTQVNRPKGERAQAYDAVTLSEDTRAEVRALTQDEAAHWPMLSAKETVAEDR
ncbi:MAG: sulfotransferase [Pseudomonadota bacterium]